VADSGDPSDRGYLDRGYFWIASVGIAGYLGVAAEFNDWVASLLSAGNA